MVHGCPIDWPRVLPCNCHPGNSGYLLVMSHSTDTSLGQRVSALLTTRNLGRPLHYVHTVTSTNTLAIEAAELDAPHGTAFLTDYQTNGYGRRGRLWQAAKGQNLTFSMILRLPISGTVTGMVPLAAALAISEAVAKTVSPNNPQLKWPNDILLEGRKICGILLQSFGAPETPIVLGIGLNVNQSTFPPELSGSATSLLLVTGQHVDRASLMANVLLRLEKILELLSTAPALIRKRYTKNLMGVGKNCQITGVNEKITGTILGIEESGALILETSKGLRTIYAGDVSLYM
ncbi:MAG: biotin--[acetyl-CoA-carboxylase] ligase, partial [Rhodothermaceae bacterium]|nr:biotin--[acetyl-CoA-carboxylase] ligase [Rhodothermaceae bacterium]